MGFTIERNNLIGFGALARSLMTDLVANGFTEVNSQVIDSDTQTATFKAGPTVDPLSTTQPWRIRISCVGYNQTGPQPTIEDQFKVYLGTSTNLPDTGPLITSTETTSTFARYIGHLDRSSDNMPSQLAGGQIGEEHHSIWHETGVYNFSGAQALLDRSARPLAYRLTVTSRGIAFCAWAEGADNTGYNFIWFVVQRPVDPTSGAVLQTGRCPVFAMWSGGGGGGSQSELMSQNLSYNNTALISDISRFVVREVDVDVPTNRVKATIHTRDSHAVINPLKQVAIAEDNKFGVTFPHGFNTQRYFYKHDLDLLGYTSADVVSQWSNVEVTVYGESTPRIYRAMPANSFNNTGMRVLILVSGGGITP